MCVGLIALCFWLAALAGSAAAQPAAPAVEIFAGYSILPADRNDDFPRRTSHGVQVSASVNFTDWFGLLADFGVQANTNRDLGPGFEGRVARTRVMEFFVGPRFVARSERVNVFAHGLVGRVRGDAGEDFSGFSDTEPAFGGGVGVDVRLQRRLALR